MAKHNRYGQAEILSIDDFKKVKDCLGSSRDRLISAICYYTGERIGAVLQLEVSSVYSDSRRGMPLDTITFPARTRKGKKDTRQVPVHEALKELLQAYEPPKEGWLFPSPRNEKVHIDRTTFDKALRHAVERAGLKDKGISTHSFRRSFITSLHKKGCSIRVIQRITKHRSLAALQNYIEVEEEDIRHAVSLLAS